MKPKATSSWISSGPLRAVTARTAWLGWFVWMASAALGAEFIYIDLPEITMLRNQPNQTFNVYLGNFDGPVLVNGIGFNIQVADGGPEVPGGSIRGPAITSVDLFTGTVFASPHNNGISGSGRIVPQVHERGTMTEWTEDGLATVSLQSGFKVATVTLDTTGVYSGIFVLTLNTLNGPTKFTTVGEDLFPTLLDGSVTIVPEPRAWGFAAGVAAMAMAGLRMVRRCSRSKREPPCRPR